MKRGLLELTLLLMVAACGAAPSDPPAAPPAAQASTSPAAAPALTAKLLGRWTMAPPPSERRTVALVRLALKDPPDDAGFGAMEPTSQERQNYANVVRLRREEPGSPLLEQLKRKIDQLDGVRLTFTERELVATTGEGTSIKAYRVEKALDRELVLIEEGDGPPESRRAVVSFVDDDNIVLTKGATRIPLMRMRGSEVARPTEAPSRPSSSRPASAQTEAASPTGGSALDVCERRYFACVDAMPPEAREAMKSSLDVVRVRFQQARSGSADAASVTDACTRVVALMHRAGYCQ